MTWDKTAKALNISTPKITHLLKIVNTFPQDLPQRHEAMEYPKEAETCLMPIFPTTTKPCRANPSTSFFFESL